MKSKESPTTASFRLALILGFGGVLLIFTIAAVDAVHLLGKMQIENEILGEASFELSHRLASIRTYTSLCRTYMGTPRPDVDRMRRAWSEAARNLNGYRSSTSEGAASLKKLDDLLQQHWRKMETALVTPSDREIVYLRTAIVEIDTRVEDTDAMQRAEAENEIRRQFESAGKRLSLVLVIALCAALLLAAGCVAYIFRIERLNSRRYQEILNARRSLEQLSARLVAAQETERRAISRELHDEVGQTLGAVLVDAANLAVRIPPEDTVSHGYLDKIRAQADASVTSIRNIALLLRPSMLDDLGLIPALEWQAREVSRRSAIKVKVSADNVSDSLPDAVRTCVYRIVQEALHNVSRHSGAKNARVSVLQKDGTLLLEVADDGSGFDPVTTRGLGLLGMEERVRQLGGRLEIQSKPGQGTTLRATLPVTE